MRTLHFHNVETMARMVFYVLGHCKFNGPNGKKFVASNGSNQVRYITPDYTICGEWVSKSNDYSTVCDDRIEWDDVDKIDYDEYDWEIDPDTFAELCPVVDKMLGFYGSLAIHCDLPYYVARKPS